MQDNVYKIIELAGSSTESIEDAIRTAVARASESVKHLRWFEVTQTRGHIENGKVAHYQVVMRIGFTVED
ncbi:MAG: dodecin [Alphaproteobacteria bacterium]